MNCDARFPLRVNYLSLEGNPENYLERRPPRPASLIRRTKTPNIDSGAKKNRRSAGKARPGAPYSIDRLHGWNVGLHGRRHRLVVAKRARSLATAKAQRKRLPTFLLIAFIYAGNDLLSHTLSRAVQSARRGLTAVFGMGTGGSPAVRSPTT